MAGRSVFRDPDAHLPDNTGPLFTRREAQEANEPNAETQRGAVLSLLRTWRLSGSTDEEMQVVLKMNPNTQRPRRVDLVASGHVEDSGRTRATTAGRQAVVWVAVTGDPTPPEKPERVDWEARAKLLEVSIRSFLTRHIQEGRGVLGVGPCQCPDCARFRDAMRVE